MFELNPGEAVTALTGAGLSTDSGIPDFRGPQGLWTRDPEAERLSTYQHWVADRAVRVEGWQRKLEAAARSPEPNPGHHALVDLEAAGVVRAVVTQNIDGLHRQAGTQHVIEVHGNNAEVVCLSCGRRTPRAETLERVRSGEEDPRCRECEGILKTGEISFGQPLDPEVWQAAESAARGCDLLLAVGTSLTVFPVAGLCELARAEGARLVIVNAQPTPYDEVADAVVRQPIGEVLPRLAEALT